MPSRRAPALGLQSSGLQGTRNRSGGACGGSGGWGREVGVLRCSREGAIRPAFPRPPRPLHLPSLVSGAVNTPHTGLRPHKTRWDIQLVPEPRDIPETMSGTLRGREGVVGEGLL